MSASVARSTQVVRNIAENQSVGYQQQGIFDFGLRLFGRVARVGVNRKFGFHIALHDKDKAHHRGSHSRSIYPGAKKSFDGSGLNFCVKTGFALQPLKNAAFEAGRWHHFGRSVQDFHKFGFLFPFGWSIGRLEQSLEQSLFLQRSIAIVVFLSEFVNRRCFHKG